MLEAFASIVSLAQTIVEVSLGPSTYIPDMIGYDSSLSSYGLVGSNAFDGSRCGGSSLGLWCTIGIWGWGIGPSSTYIPDSFWFNLGFIAYTRVGGANNHGLVDGAHALELSSFVDLGYSDIGPSLSYIADYFSFYNDNVFVYSGVGGAIDGFAVGAHAFQYFTTSEASAWWFIGVFLYLHTR